MLKLAALGALGYAGYKYFQKNQTNRLDTSDRRNAVAGGPLTDNARIRTNPRPPLA